MGNSSSSSGRGQQDETVDFGSLLPQGVYTGPRDWNQAIVSQLIVARKLAPFYRPLEDYEESWDDERVLAARKELTDPDNADTVTRIETSSTASSHTGSLKSKRTNSLKEPVRPEAQIYRGAIECPICFLFYPPNINRSRCCDQAICTECFVQIKRSEPTTTHIVSELAACPYCVQENFGIVYTPPTWRAGLGSEHGSWPDIPRSPLEPSSPPTHKRRQKSFGADSAEVVLIDHIRPDWEAKLEAVRSAVARRANRRIIMRQVGDRLIPVGVTSGRVHALSPEEAAAAAEAGVSPPSRRGRRRGGGDGNEQTYMGMSGQDLEELMMMEAMRLSLLEHEEHQRKEAAEKKKQETEAAGAGGGVSGESSTSVANQAPAAGTSSSPDSGSGATTDSAGPSSPTRLTIKSNILHPSTSNPNLTASPSSSSRRSPSRDSKHGVTDSVDSLLKGRKSWSISRSKTPPPPSQTQNGSSSNVPAYSTLRAAMATTSTAAAVLVSSPASSEGQQDGSCSSIPIITVHDPASPNPALASIDTAAILPNGITPSSASVSAESDDTPNPSSANGFAAGQSSTSTSTISGVNQDTAEAAIDDSGGLPAQNDAEDTDTEQNGYGVLASSPESLATEPLLGKGGANTGSTTMHVEEVLR